MDSFVRFAEYPVEQTEVASQEIAINKFREVLIDCNNINVSRSILNGFHDPQKGVEMATAIFGASEAQAERELITSTFPKSDLKTWTAEKNAIAERFLDGALDRAETVFKRLHAEVDENYMGTLHEREARFNEFIASAVLKLRLRGT